MSRKRPNPNPRAREAPTRRKGGSRRLRLTDTYCADLEVVDGAYASAGIPANVR